MIYILAPLPGIANSMKAKNQSEELGIMDCKITVVHY